MKIVYATLETCAEAAGTVVAIDVIRAFTTAAYAFAAGVREIMLVGTVEEAFALREAMPDALMMGEVGGQHIPGFDFSNSPAALVGLDLAGRRMIQRTSAGTQGIVRSVHADQLLAASFVCAGATARYLLARAPEHVTLVATEVRSDVTGDEDVACAEYLALLLRGDTPDVAPFVQRARQSHGGLLLAPVPPPGFMAGDLECCVAVDRFDFAMPVERRDGWLVMTPVRSSI